MKKQGLIPGALLVFAIFAIKGPQGAELYHVQNLGSTFGTTNSYAHGINDEGDVVGYYKDTNDLFRAFLLKSAEWTDLGTAGTNTYALHLNGSGHVVGYSESTNGATAFHSHGTTFTDLGPLGGINSYAHGINDFTNIVGYMDTTNGAVAVIHSNGSTTNLGNLGGTNSFGFVINVSNLVVGSSLDPSNAVLNAFVWGSTGMTNLNQLIPTNSGWFLREARGVNGSGAIVGWGLTNDVEHGFLLEEGSIMDLAPLSGGTNSYGLSLNDSNVVVGAGTTTGGNIHAFIWREGQLQDLNDLIPTNSGWVLKEARSINNSGKIVGWGVLDGEEQAFLLTPNQKPSVSLTLPTNNSSLTYPAGVTLTVTASDADGSVTKVEFLADAVLIGTDTNSPYSITWNPSEAGIYSLTARATDDSNGEASSAGNTLNYHGPSSVAIVSPTNGSVFSFVTNIAVSVTATNPLSSITNVALLIDGKEKLSTGSGPYAFDWTNPPAGAYTLTARAKDEGGFSAISLPVDVVVFQGSTGSGPNLAKNKTATQSSAGYSPASYAVDGNTNGNWYANSVAHTGADAQAWWEVDLGSVEDITQVRIWNRTDCCGYRLSNFYLLVSDNAFTSTSLGTATNQSGVSSYYHSGAAGTLATFQVNRTGRYLRVQLTGTDYLQLAEVEVLGEESAPGAPGDLLAEALSPAQVSVRWTNAAVAETKIERKNPGEDRFYVVGVAPEGAGSFIDSGLAANQTYTYRFELGAGRAFRVTQTRRP